MAASRGAQTRADILGHAVDLASAEGLCGLTIGRLAEDLGMSKSGLFRHFGSKDDLQLAVIDTAAMIFEQRVMEPVADCEPGLAKLIALWSSWCLHIEKSPYRGGCFFAAAGLEFDGRPGEVRDRIAKASHAWLKTLSAELRLAQRLGEITKRADTDQLAFELHGAVQQGNWARQLLKSSDAFRHARIAVVTRLQGVVTQSGAPLLRPLELSSPRRKGNRS